VKYNLELFSGVHGCRACKLSEFRLEAGTLPTPALPGAKYQEHGLALLCEAPGADEELEGEPLVGRAGRLTNQLLKAAGLSRDEVLLLNRVKCRPPGNRIKDWPEAIANCNPWTGKELAVYNPSVVVLMGATAMSAIFGAQVKVTQTRGSFAAKGEKHEWGKRVYGSTWHPAAVLRNGGASSEVGQQLVADLVAAKKVMEELR
jgi:DNA polymerase